MKKLSKLIVLLAIVLVNCFCCLAQNEEKYKPLVLNLNESGSKYLRVILVNQVWLTSNNLALDNSLSINASIRRSRVQAYAQMSPKFILFTQFGANSITPSNVLSGNNKTSFLLHDAWSEYSINSKTFLGAGLHYYGGLTRLSSQGILKFLTLDQSRPFVHWHSSGVTDQAGRHLGVYLKGSINKVEYRISVNNPMQSGNTNNFVDSFATVMPTNGLNYNGNLFLKNNNKVGNTIIDAYFKFNFADMEPSKLPFMSGTHLGKKKVVALGAGFFAQPNGMYNQTESTHENVFHVAADLFADIPTNDGCFTSYLAYMKFDYGENYVSRWAGTGNSIYMHAGYYYEKKKVMPYFAYGLSNFDALEEDVSSLNLGVNYFIAGHNSKVTLEYQLIKNDFRESFISAQNPNFSQVRLQYHVFL